MDAPPLALLLSRSAVLRESRSAYPDAPVVEPRRTRTPAPRAATAVRTRTALAAGLHRLADTVSPACSPHDAHPAR